MTGSGDDKEGKLWRDVGDALNAAGELPSGPATTSGSPARRAPQEKGVVAGAELGDDERFGELIEELYAVNTVTRSYVRTVRKKMRNLTTIS